MIFRSDIFPFKIILDIEEIGLGDDGICELKEIPRIVLYKDMTSDWRNILLHETIHAVSFLLRYIGIEHTESTEEVYCYTIEYFYASMAKRIEKESLL